jgi:hypothetical protein
MTRPATIEPPPLPTDTKSKVSSKVRSAIPFPFHFPFVGLAGLLRAIAPVATHYWVSAGEQLQE